MLRFPLNVKIKLITPIGIINCIIKHITNHYLYCVDVYIEYNRTKLNDLYLNRNNVFGFHEVQNKIELNSKKTNKTKIINFSDYFNNKINKKIINGVN